MRYNNYLWAGKDEFYFIMRNKRRNDNYVSQKINNIINSIPNNPFIGFGNFINPADKPVVNTDDWYESEYDDSNDPYEP